MNRQNYIDFVEKFESLSPYQLDHLSMIMHKNYLMIAERLQPNSKTQLLNQSDMKDLIISCMRSAHLELAEEKLKEAEYNLEMTKLKTNLSSVKE